MRRFGILISLLLCVFLPSCQKDPQDLLIGVWEISSKTIDTTGSSEATVEHPVQYYKFEEHGEGKILSFETSTELQDLDDWFFTYVYDKAKSTLVFESWVKKEKTTWIVDELTDKVLTCHSLTNGLLTTFNGKKAE
jgi:hypothetical protein